MLFAAKMKDAQSGLRDRHTPLKASRHSGMGRITEQLAADKGAGFDLYRDQVFYGERLQGVLKAVERLKEQRVLRALEDMGENGGTIPTTDDWRWSWFQELLLADEEHGALVLLQRDLTELIATDLALVFLSD